MGPKKCLKSSRHVFHHPKAKQRPQNIGKRYRNKNGLHNRVAIGQLVARKFHNPKVASSILTCHIATRIIPAPFFSTPCQTAVAVAPGSSALPESAGQTCLPEAGRGRLTTGGRDDLGIFLAPRIDEASWDKKCLKSSRYVFHHPKAKQRPQNIGKRYRNKNGLHNRVAIAQLVARRSHNPKVVSSILTCHIATRIIPAPFFSTPCQTALAVAPEAVLCLRAPASPACGGREVDSRRGGMI